MKFGVCGFVKLGQRVVIKTTVNISQKRVGFTRTKKKNPRHTFLNFRQTHVINLSIMDCLHFIIINTQKKV